MEPGSEAEEDTQLSIYREQTQLWCGHPRKKEIWYHTPWMTLKTLLMEASQSQKDKYCMTLLDDIFRVLNPKVSLEGYFLNGYKVSDLQMKRGAK